MAATVDSSLITLSAPFGEYTWQLSSIVSDQLEVLTHSGFSGIRPDFIQMVVVVPPTDRSVLQLQYDQDTAFNTTANTCSLRIVCPLGGSADGAKVKIIARFTAMKAGGISA